MKNTNGTGVRTTIETLKARGKSVNQIAQALNAKKVRNSRGNRWTYGSVYQYLSTPTKTAERPVRDNDVNPAETVTPNPAVYGATTTFATQIIDNVDLGLTADQKLGLIKLFATVNNA